MPKWTKGLWQNETWPARDYDDQKRPRMVIIADGAYLCELEDAFSKVGHEEQEANARLIAAAPEMAELLGHVPHTEQDALHQTIGTVAGCPGCDARAILARIEGE